MLILLHLLLLPLFFLFFKHPELLLYLLQVLRSRIHCISGNIHLRSLRRSSRLRSPPRSRHPRDSRSLRHILLWFILNTQYIILSPKLVPLRPRHQLLACHACSSRIPSPLTHQRHHPVGRTEQCGSAARFSSGGELWFLLGHHDGVDVVRVVVAWRCDGWLH